MSHDLDILALDDAVNRAEYDEVKALLDRGVSPNARDVIGDTPLMNAAWIGAPEVVSLLLARGAEVNDRGRDGLTALGRLRRGTGYWHDGHDDVVRILLAAGAVE